MSHDTHHHAETTAKPQAAGKSSLWMAVIIVGLFIAAVNFINVMSHDDGGHETGGHGATEKHTTQDASHIEATPQQNITKDPSAEPSEKSDLPHEENAPNKAPSEAEKGH